MRRMVTHHTTIMVILSYPHVTANHLTANTSFGSASRKEGSVPNQEKEHMHRARHRTRHRKEISASCTTCASSGPHTLAHTHMHNKPTASQSDNTFPKTKNSHHIMAASHTHTQAVPCSGKPWRSSTHHSPCQGTTHALVQRTHASRGASGSAAHHDSKPHAHSSRAISAMQRPTQQSMPQSITAI